ncbi:hypothetical protein PGT21_005066 [Puccinia graminis f. sp. tritici]|uniref:Uncharacterized protein n=1 Tax=Puccinia graminis f. sp. tritici TaxID=56615 RepID=A0A5B0PR39_PUCGR|nr:hypothetical protein PGT21_005066 [Puccinia graminis f. sp. tritici]
MPFRETATTIDLPREGHIQPHNTLSKTPPCFVKQPLLHIIHHPKSIQAQFIQESEDFAWSGPVKTFIRNRLIGAFIDNTQPDVLQIFPGYIDQNLIRYRMSARASHQLKTTHTDWEKTANSAHRSKPWDWSRTRGQEDAPLLRSPPA